MPPLIWFLLHSAPPTLAACYYPNGSISPNDMPCRDDTAESTCCGTGYACLANGMCQATGKELPKEGATELVRGACTDRSWRSSSCPLFCINPEMDNFGGGIGVGRCEGTTEELYYCIHLVMDRVNCTGKKNVLFFQQPASAFTTIGVVPTTVALPSTTSATTSETPSNNPSTTHQQHRHLPSSTRPNFQVRAQSSRAASNDRAVTIGAAVGASVGVLALGILGVWLFFFLRRRRQRRETEPVGYREREAGSYHNPQTQFHEAPGDWKTPVTHQQQYSTPHELPGWDGPRR
ncbi:hypothetical protein CMUS01_05329 [Colletotrichum musicola]|uniref:Mid2 domain-containing protein n=1 Tax=Colletotrichum musicola TaxID=2175873 RepID=A0A8H6KSU3_9PEZI|nr:hypothetical protein CMUS01_05329 [Colletotrichum musicola]